MKIATCEALTNLHTHLKEAESAWLDVVNQFEDYGRNLERTQVAIKRVKDLAESMEYWFRTEA